MTDKRYQVFVSSTYEDLKAERQAVMLALQGLDCIPVGMEIFTAEDESQWQVIQRIIQECDYYVLIIGGRYGSLHPSGLSYTEMEYNYAQSIKKPVIACVHDNPGGIETAKTKRTDEGKAKLEKFKERVKTKLCAGWHDPNGLAGQVCLGLAKLMKNKPAVGWVRADQLADAEATTEILRLRKEVETLKAEIAQSRTQAPPGSDDFAGGDDRDKFEFSFDASLGERSYHKAHACKVSSTWNMVFSAVAPLMIHEASDAAFRLALNKWAEKAFKDVLEREGYSNIKYLKVTDADFQRIKVQLRALGLIKKSEKSRSVKDTDTYWTLTPYGDEAMTRLLAVKKVQRESMFAGSDIPFEEYDGAEEEDGVEEEIPF